MLFLVSLCFTLCAAVPRCLSLCDVVCCALSAARYLLRVTCSVATLSASRCVLRV